MWVLGVVTVTDPTSETQLGRLAVDRRLLTVQELNTCLARQKELARGGTHVPLSEVMLKAGLLTRRQLHRLGADLEKPAAVATQLFPGYEVLGKLGSGSMASVFKARQLSLDRIVALKVLTRKLAANAEYVERFHQEGRAVAKLNHPNIVQVIDVDAADGLHFLVMEYVDGPSVGDELAAGKVYPEPQAIGVIVQVARALEHASAKGFVHRDVKPKNIMLTRDGTAKLADLGLARHTADVKAAMAETGRVYGTPYYISPEQIRGDADIDFRADMYGLGATFYHMVTGKVPFEGAVPAAIMRQHLNTPLVPPDHIRPDISEGVGEVIEIMMAKKREDRYPSFGVFIQDLEARARGERPVQLGRRRTTELLTRLAEEGELVPPAPAVTDGPVKPGQITIPLPWLVALLAVAAASILLNLVQCALH